MPDRATSPQVLVAQGFNNPAGLGAFTVRPRCSGLIYPVQRISLAGKVYYDGYPSIRLDFGQRVPSWVLENALDVCGLSRTSFWANVTVKIPDNDDRATARNYNGRAQYPFEWDYERGGWNNFILTIGFLETI